MNTILFIYGTLKEGKPRYHWIGDQKRIGVGMTKPLYQMVNVGTFPGLVETKIKRAIQGEIWEVAPNRMNELNRIEGVSQGLFELREIQLANPFHKLKAYAYFYARRNAHLLEDAGTNW